MNSTLHTYWRKLARGSRNGLPDQLLLAILTPFAAMYSLAQALRSQLYRSGALQTRKLPRPVISIGNITVGGTGKTPVTAFIARRLLSQGLRVAVLSRGYGGTLEGQSAIVSDGQQTLLEAWQCGDEPYLLASTVAGLMVVIGSDRHAAGMLALEKLSPDVFLLDDGFQHIRLHRDLDILLLDHSRPFGNGRTLPAGLLREPRRAAERADIHIHTRCPKGAPAVPAIGGKPSCRARHTLRDALPLKGGTPFPFGILRDRKALAFAGIAEPQNFFEGLHSQGVNLVSTVAFPDHVSYDGSRIAELAGAMEASGADTLVTTEKDGVKLKQMPENLAARTLLARLDLAIDDPAPLETMLARVLGEHHSTSSDGNDKESCGTGLR
ncbi:MAG: tetraacyldisaccharide 4'-kinase [Desulfuromonadales bacterium]|nr:tetraacyldisaccharide 4'-kinase [Desulfuromonadales bacterium]